MGENIYEVTKFINIHPGRGDIIKAFSGRCLDDILFNKHLHEHKIDVINKLVKFKYGSIKT